MKTTKEEIKKEVERINSARKLNGREYVIVMNTGEVEIYESEPSCVSGVHGLNSYEHAGFVRDYIEVSNELTPGEAYTKMMIEKTGFTFKYAK